MKIKKCTFCGATMRITLIQKRVTEFSDLVRFDCTGCEIGWIANKPLE